VFRNLVEIKIVAFQEFADRLFPALLIFNVRFKFNHFAEELSSEFIGHSKIPIATKQRSLEHLGVVRFACDEGYILAFRNLHQNI